MSITSRREAARETSGRFGVQYRSESPVALAAPTRTVRTADGMRVAVTPGVLDDAAGHAFNNGQCLGLAVAVAEHNGWGVAVRTYDEAGLVAHAWAVSPDGRLHDVRGAHDEMSVEEELDGDDQIEHYRSDEIGMVLEDFEGRIGVQDMTLARSFAPAFG